MIFNLDSDLDSILSDWTVCTTDDDQTDAQYGNVWRSVPALVAELKALRIEKRVMPSTQPEGVTVRECAECDEPRNRHIGKPPGLGDHWYSTYLTGGTQDDPQ